MRVNRIGKREFQMDLFFCLCGEKMLASKCRGSRSFFLSLSPLNLATSSLAAMIGGNLVSSCFWIIERAIVSWLVPRVMTRREIPSLSLVADLPIIFAEVKPPLCLAYTLCFAAPACRLLLRPLSCQRARAPIAPRYKQIQFYVKYPRKREKEKGWGETPWNSLSNFIHLASTSTKSSPVPGNDHKGTFQFIGY